MIDSLVTFVESIIEKKYSEIEKYLNDITHPVMRGDMFEGLTKFIVKNTFGKLPDIHVCEGLIKNTRTGKISPQTDLIIYIGEAEQVPLTTHFIVPIDNVLAFIEVKKTLGYKELYDFYDKQSEIYGLVDDYCKFDGELVSCVSKQIFRRSHMNNDIAKSISTLAYYLYNIIIVENAAPLRICLGYDGFSREDTLRKNLLKVIEERGKNGLDHTGMNSLPSLIISKDICLTKMVGMPYASIFNDPYLVMGSLKCNTWEVLMQMIISKVESKTNVRFELSSDDFESFSFNPYLWATIDTKHNNVTKFEYSPICTKKLKRKIIKRKWEPTFITDYEFIVVNKLAELSWSQEPIMKVDDELFAEHNLVEELSNLLNNNIISIHDDVIELITTECVAGIVLDGQYVVGENNAGQMNDWILHNAIKK